MREMKRVPLQALEKVAQKAWRKWKKGSTVFREMTMIRIMTTMEIFENKVFDVGWTTSLLPDPNFPNDEARKRFGSHLESSLLGRDRVSVSLGREIEVDSDLMSAMAFMVLRSMVHSDTPNWFRLTQGLFYELLVTELKDVQVKDVQMPYPGFYIEIPEDILYWKNDTTGWHEVRMIGVAEGCPSQEDLPGVDAGILGRRLLIIVYAEPNENSVDPSDDNVTYFSISLTDDDATVDALFERDLEWIEQNEKWNTHKNKVMGRFGAREMTTGEMQDLVRSFVTNVLLYFSSEGAEVKHIHEETIAKIKRKKTKLRKTEKARLKRLQEDRIYELGTTIVVNPDIEKHVRGKSKGPKFELKHRTLVRGHWRNQAHGPGWSLRKRVWIKPFVKKKELAERVLGHNYEVE